jgi:hypothetical protein
LKTQSHGKAAVEGVVAGGAGEVKSGLSSPVQPCQAPRTLKTQPRGKGAIEGVVAIPVQARDRGWEAITAALKAQARGSIAIEGAAAPPVGHDFCDLQFSVKKKPTSSGCLMGLGIEQLVAASVQVKCRMDAAMASHEAMSKAMAVEVRLLDLYVRLDAALGSCAAVVIAVEIGEAEAELYELERSHAQSAPRCDGAKSAGGVGKHRRRRRPG